MYNIFKIVEYVIKYSTSNGIPVNAFRLQIILYFIQAEFMVSKKIPCFNDKIEAWDFMPTIPTVYRKYQGAMWSTLFPTNNMSVENEIATKDIKAINEIVDQCSHYSVATLAEITRNQTPWIKARNSVFKEISLESLYEFFKEQ